MPVLFRPCTRRCTGLGRPCTREAYEFALRSQPWPKPIDHDLNKHPGVFKLPDEKDEESPIGRWIREPVAEDENTVDLELCHHDKDDHLEPINLDEYTDHFDNCGYFAEAESDDTINLKTLASASTQMAADDQMASTGEEPADVSLMQQAANEVERLEARLATSSEDLGEEHPSTLASMANLASTYANQERWEEAKSMYQRALEGLTKALGQGHPSTLDTVNSLGNLYYDQRRLAEAENLYALALEGYMKALGPDHTSTLNTTNNLANIYYDEGELLRAEELYTRALQGREKALGPDYILTLDTANNLALLYSHQDRLDEAGEIYERVLQGHEKAFGADHPSTLDTADSLGDIYYDQGRFAEAKRLYDRALQGNKKALEPDHASTLTTTNNILAKFDSDQSRLDYGGEASDYKCGICGWQSRESVYSATNLRKHKQKHLKRTFYCPSADCHRPFLRPDNLRRHIKDRHPRASVPTELLFHAKYEAPVKKRFTSSSTR